MSTYNRWKNYETWNVALWLGSDEGLYDIVKGCNTYGDFLNKLIHYPLYNECTPDGIGWVNSKLDIKALGELVKEIS